MTQFLKREPKEEPARQRYPEVLWTLLTLGKPDENIDYGQLAKPLADYVPDLIHIALDEDLNYRKESDPAVWAPLHAIHILGALGAMEAAEPLTQCLDWDDDWIGQALPGIYASIGPSAVPILQAYLEDATNDTWGRITASQALTAIGQAHSVERDAIVHQLADYLDRPSADNNADEELVTSFVISNLADLEAVEAYSAIKRAFEEDRVTPSVVTLEDVEIDFGKRPEPDYSKLEPPKEPGVRLELKCKSCGRERSYLFPKVYCDLGTMRNKRKRAKYNPIIIPQLVVCSKCGAVDQYEFSGLGQAAILADLLTQTSEELKDLRREDQHVQYLEFEAMGRRMHPQEAIERYRAEIAHHPEESNLYVGYGNVLRFLGRLNEAKTQYQRAVELDPLNSLAYVDMAHLALMQQNKSEAVAMWQKVLEVTRSSRLSEEDKLIVLQSAHEAIGAIRTGREDEILFDPVLDQTSSQASTKNGKAQPASKRTRRRRKATSLPSSKTRIPKRVTSKSAAVGRNDPCPCGSGKKYKHCCMVKQKK